MGSTWQSLLDRLVEVRDQDYRTDNDRADAILDNLETTVQTMLEKLRDAERPF